MRRGRAGLSLLEMLVSLALMAVIAAGLSASLLLGVRSYDRIGEAAKLQPELARRAQLRRWISTTISPDRLSNISLEFEASPSSLRFVTFASTPFAPDAAALRVTVTLGGEITMLAEALDDVGHVIEVFDGVLARDIENARLSYFDATADPPLWRDSWSDVARLPALIRITADQGSNPEWPEMTVRLQQAVLPKP
ncbi:PulJ/GspJ family protein [Aliiroseovarius sp. CAU 1755]